MNIPARPEFDWRALARLTLGTIEHTVQSSTNMREAYLHSAAWRVFRAMEAQDPDRALTVPPVAQGVPAVRTWIEACLR
jgi:hypothetical protein